MEKGSRNFIRGLSYVAGFCMCITVVLSWFGVILILLAMISEQLEK